MVYCILDIIYLKKTVNCFFKARVSRTACGSLAPLKGRSGHDKTSNLNLHLIVIRIELITF